MAKPNELARSTDLSRVWERYDYIAEQLRLGRTQSSIAQELNITQQRISAIKKTLNIESRTQKPEWTNFKKVVNAYKKGKSLAYIEKKFGVSGKQLYRYLRKAEVPLRDPKLAAAQRTARMAPQFNCPTISPDKTR